MKSLFMSNFRRHKKVFTTSTESNEDKMNVDDREAKKKSIVIIKV